MRYTSDDQRRYAFRDWLREQLVALDFYQRRGDRYLVSEFARYANSLGARVEEVSLGRYLRDDNPVLPTPESCRELAKALDKHPTEVLLEAGYLSLDDFYFMPSVGVTQESLNNQIQAIGNYTYMPEAIRAQMQRSLQAQLLQVAVQGDGPREDREQEEEHIPVTPTAPAVTGTPSKPSLPAHSQAIELQGQVKDQKQQQSSEILSKDSSRP